jgi:hypothetical protein
LDAVFAEHFVDLGKMITKERRSRHVINVLWFIAMASILPGQSEIALAAENSAPNEISGSLDNRLQLIPEANLSLNRLTADDNNHMLGASNYSKSYATLTEPIRMNVNSDKPIFSAPFMSVPAPIRMNTDLNGSPYQDKNSLLWKPLTFSIGPPVQSLPKSLTITTSEHHERWQLNIDDYEPMNEQQKTISAGISHDPDTYVYFASPDQYEAIGATPLPKMTAPKSWTLGERFQISMVIWALLEQAPGLLLAASSGNKIALCRISDENYYEPHHKTMLSSKSNIIFIPDWFFESSSFWCCQYFAHELLHLTDVACRLSFSREWVKFANPVIKKVRQQEKSHSLEFLSSRIRKNNIWPDLLGCRNLEESFAYYFNEYLFASDFRLAPKEIQRFSHYFLLPSHKEQLFSLHFIRGKHALAEKNLLLARSEFLAAKRLNPLVGRVYLDLAGTYPKTQENYKVKLTYCQEACDIFWQAGVPRDEYYFDLAVRGRDWYWWKLHSRDAYRTKKRSTRHLHRSTHVSPKIVPRASISPCVKAKSKSAR